MDGLRILIGLLGLAWFGWSAAALLRGASQRRVGMLWQIGMWQLVSAFGAFLVLTSGFWSLFLIIGLGLMALNPIFWSLGKVSDRLKSHGVRVGELLRFK